MTSFFVLGSKDETAGCQLCVAMVADDGSLTLRLRLPDALAGQHGKYLTVEGVRFKYGQGAGAGGPGGQCRIFPIPGPAW